MVVKCEVLGDICAFSGSDIKVLKDLYDRVPEMFQSDFDTVLESAKSRYQDLVNQVKAGGKCSPTQCKKQAIEEIVSPFLYRLGLANYKAVKTVIHGTKDPSSAPVRVERRSPLVETPVDTSGLGDLFDNYNWDEEIVENTTSIVDTSEQITVDLGFDGLFNSEDSFSLDDLNF